MVETKISWRSLLRIIVAIAICFLLRDLAPLIGLVLIAVIVGTTFDVVVNKLSQFGLRRRYSIALLIAATAVVFLLVGLVLVPAIVLQAQGVIDSLPNIKQQIIKNLPNGFIGDKIQATLEHPEQLMSSIAKHAVTLGSASLYGVTSLFVTIVLAFYFLIEGRLTFQWLITFFNRTTQAKLRQTANSAREIVAAYVIGQLITSAIVGVYSGAVLAFLGVPAPAMLGVMTALLDIVPTIGVIIAITLTCLLALTVSLSATMWVAVAFAIYQALENYVLSPLIYGKRMRLSNLAVILSVAVGAKLAGIIGIILALPIAAAYPVIEQIWLKRYLGEETIEEHQAIQETPAKDLS